MIHIISDLHLTPAEDALLVRFRAYLKQLNPGDSLFILGDLFEYWLGDDACEYLGQKQVEQALTGLAGQGISTSFMRGNRDFLIGKDFAERCGITLLDDEHLLQLGDQSILLMHGDNLCTDDRSHQVFRKMVRDQAWQDDFLSQPLSIRDEMAKAVRYRSESGKTLKASAIMDVTQRAVDDVMRLHGVELLIHGHTHRPAVHQLSLPGSVSAHRVVLGDWGQAPSFIRLDQHTLELVHAGKSDRLVI
ncbi:MAG TPA: UDP-2,3-diacylglucosamine diphosphatase [Arenicellales bacterium]|nr:UDP-2,3-diacylglucosamine diphosphatase [Arenicellales bacterium]HJL55942.1 UDP-2,3-diacylglucosamine diphosphatase [Arenicellales bacterium]